jgi:hypothetical protein
VQQHPQYSLRAIEAALRQLAAEPASRKVTGFDLQALAMQLPIAAWFLQSVTSPQFWSGAESGDLVLHVASLLRTCIKVCSCER